MEKSLTRKEELRELLVKHCPRWKGRIWIYPYSVRLAGVGTTWWRDDSVPVEKEAEWFADEFKILEEHSGH